MSGATAKVDAVVVGAGVIGLAVARALAQAGREVLVLEAGGSIGTETSSRNSEVIHAGIYYPPGSLKAATCVEGKWRLYAYCAERGVAHARIGKMIVASSDEEIATLEGYRERARVNGAGALEWLDRRRLEALEPAVRGVAGLLSPTTGIVDSHQLMLALQGDLEAAGGWIAFRAPVHAAVATAAGIRIDVGGEAPMRLAARTLVNAAGLYAPALARAIEGLPADCVPSARFARGRYYGYSGSVPFSRLIYPVARAGGLGVHVTFDLGGRARFGPDVEWIEGIDYAFDDSARETFIAAIRSYWPDVDPARLAPDYTGIRPKLSAPGEPAADFRIDGPERHGIPGLVNLFGIESPGLTASLALADRVVRRAGAAAG